MSALARAALVLTAACAAAAGLAAAGAAETPAPVITTVHRVPQPVGLMITTGGWAYCEQLRRLARRTRYTLLCGRYFRDGYTGPGLRSRRHLDWGEARYLSSLAARVRALHGAVGGRLVLVGVSYSGFGVAALASHHPELQPDRLIVIDSYLDLVARRAALPDQHITAREIDTETGGSLRSLRERSVRVAGLARLVRDGALLSFVWSVSDQERRYFNGATCGTHATAATLLQLARRLERPVEAWVTSTPHGRNLYVHGPRIVRGRHPGRRFVFRPGATIPPGAVCRS